MREISNAVSVFISSAANHREIENKIRDALLEKHFNVFLPDDISKGEVYSQVINNAITSASRSGFVLLLVSDQSINSAFVLKEVQLTREQGGKIIPVYIENPPLSEELKDLIGHEVGCSISLNPTNQEVEQLIDSILSRLKFSSLINKFWTSHGF